MGHSNVWPPYICLVKVKRPHRWTRFERVFQNCTNLWRFQPIMKHPFTKNLLKITDLFQRKRYERKTRRWKQSSSQGWVSSILMLLVLEHHKIIFKYQFLIFQIMVNAALWQINAVHRLKFQNDFSSTFLVLLSPFSSISPPFWPFHGLASLLFDIQKVRNSLTDYLYHSCINIGCTRACWSPIVDGGNNQGDHYWWHHWKCTN